MRLKTARWLSAAWACAACTSLAREAHAQAQGFAVDQFEPSERGSDWFSVESLDLRGSLRPAVGVVMDGAYRPLVVYAPDGTVERSIVRKQIFAHAGASLVLGDRLRVGFNLPIAVFQDGHAGVVDGVTLAPPGASSARTANPSRSPSERASSFRPGSATTTPVTARFDSTVASRSRSTSTSSPTRHAPASSTETSTPRSVAARSARSCSSARRPVFASSTTPW